MPLRAFWMSMGLTMTPGYPRPPRPMRGYGRGVRAATIAGLLADPTRLKVVAALALGAGTLEEVAEATGLPLRDVALAARRLGRAGLVRRDRHELELLTDRFGAAARAAAGRPRRGRRPVRVRPRRPAGVHPRAADQAADRARAPGPRVRRRCPLPRARGERAAGGVAPRHRRAAPLPGRRGPAHPRGRSLLAQRRVGRRLTQPSSRSTT